MPDNVRLFIGADPGTKGACAVLACVDSPLDDAEHGKVVGFDVFDLPTIERPEIGGTDLDAWTFIVRFNLAVANVRQSVGDHALVSMSAVVEYPDLGGQMKGGRRQAVAQGLNAGAVFAALAVRTKSAQWVASRSWRSELGGVAKGDEGRAAISVLGHLPANPIKPILIAIGTQDRCVAVLLADLLRRRWLGTAVAPKTKGAAKAVKARKSAERKAALERAVAPMKMAKARETARLEHWCSAHGSGTPDFGVVPNQDCDVPPTVFCLPRNSCCEARLLDWAWRQRPEPTAESLGLGAAGVELLPRVAAIYKRSVTSKAWTVAWTDSEETGTMTAEHFDALEAHGLVQLQAGVKFVRYQPTERGLAWARRLLVPAVAAAIDPGLALADAAR